MEREWSTDDRVSEGGVEPSPGGPTFSVVQIASVLVLGAFGSLVSALQPILLGPLAEAGRLTIKEIGLAAMLEAFGMAAAVAISGVLLRPRRLKLLSIAAALVSVLANAAAAIGSHEAILAARLVNGLSAGVILWVWTGLLTNVALPGRLVAIFVALQSTGVLAVSYLLSSFVVPRWGAAGGYGVLMLLSAGLMVLGLAVPTEYRAPAQDAGTRLRLPGGRGLAGLFAVFLHLAAIMALWVYVLPLGRQFGLSDTFVKLTVTMALAAQIAGGMSAAVFARVPAKLALYACIAFSMFALLILGFGSGPSTFMVSLIVISFFYMFAPGFQMPYLLQVDPSRRAGMQMITAQLLGMSMGPALSSLVVRTGDLKASILVSAVLFAGSMALIFATTRRQVIHAPAAISVE